MFSHTSFNITESNKRVSGGETFVVKGWWIIWVEEQGSSVLKISVATIWFGSKGGSWTYSKTNGEDEFKMVPVWIACSSSTS